mgnify:CR=1 FL=1
MSKNRIFVSFAAVLVAVAFAAVFVSFLVARRCRSGVVFDQLAFAETADLSTALQFTAFDTRLIFDRFPGARSQGPALQSSPEPSQNGVRSRTYFFNYILVIESVLGVIDIILCNYVTYAFLFSFFTSIFIYFL